MKKLLLIISLVTFGAHSANSQESLEDIPTYKTTRIARANTKKQLDSLRISLEITPRDGKLRNFELEYCVQKNDEKRSGLNYTPAGNFPIVSGCPGMYIYTFKEKSDGSHYYVTFFYNDQGQIVEKEIGYMLSTH